MCATFQQRPSAVARPLLEGDLPPGTVTELDWYAFDVAMAALYLAKKAEADRRAMEDEEAPDYSEHMPGAYRGLARGGKAAPIAGARNGPVIEGGENLYIRGTETLPSVRRRQGDG